MFLQDLLDKAQEILQKSEALEKAYKKDGRWLPNVDDAGKPHPEDNTQVGHIDKLGSPVWAHRQGVTDNHVSRIRSNFDKLKLSGPGKQKIADLTHHIFQDPDHGVLASGTTNGHKGSFNELRMRHISNAMSGFNGASLEEHPNGEIHITSDRHSNNPSNKNASTKWSWDGKTLKSFTKKPMSDTVAEGEYTYDPKNLKKSDGWLPLGAQSQVRGNDGSRLGSSRPRSGNDTPRVRHGINLGSLAKSDALVPGLEALAKSISAKIPRHPIHETLSEIGAKMGTKAAKTASNSLLSLLHPDDHESLKKSVASAGYNDHPVHIINRVRTLMISPSQRAAFHAGKGKREAKAHHERMRKSWSAMVGACKEFNGGSK